MKELYDFLTTLDRTSTAKALNLVEKKLYALCEKGQEGVGYYFLILKNGLRVYPFYIQNKKQEIQKPFDDLTNSLYQFLKVNRIHSIFIRKEVDVKLLLEYLRNEGPRPPQVVTDVYERDFELSSKIFEALLTILLYPSQQLNSMIRAIGDYQKTQDPKLKEALQKTHADWFATHNQLTTHIEEVLSRYSRITFIMRYPLGKIRSNDIEPEGFHIFFEEAELDLEYSPLRKSEFFRKAIYMVKGERRDRLDSLVLKRGMDVEDLLSLVYKIRGKDKLIFHLKMDYQPYLDQKQFPEEFQSKFGARYPLPEEAKIEVVTPGEKWYLKDATKAIKYIIEKAENKLEVYQKVDEIPHVKVNPIKVGVLDIEDEFSDFIVVHKKNDKLKELVLRLKKHNSHFQSLINQLQAQNKELQEQLQEERDRKGGYHEIQNLEKKIEKLQQEQEDAELAKQMILDELDKITSEDMNPEFLTKISKTLKLSQEEVLKLLPGNLVEDMVEDKIRNGKHDETMSLFIQAGKVIPVVEKRLRQGQLSAHNIRNFFIESSNPMEAKVLTKNFAEQLSSSTTLPHMPGYHFEVYSDFSPQPGGDACFFYPLDFARVAVLLLDTEGTGLEQSCNLLSAKILFENLLEHMKAESPEKILFALHEEVVALRKTDSHFPCFSGLLGILHGLENTFTYIRSSLPYVYLYNRNHSSGHFIREMGVPRIGLKTDPEHYQKKPYKIDLKPSDVLFIQTNGLMDCLGGPDSFASLMDYLPSKEMEKFFREKVEQTRNGRPLEDDIYLFSMEFLA